MDVFEAIKERRSIRKYKKEPISDDLVLKVIEAAIWAPSSKNRQPWEFIIIRNEDTKRKLAELAPFGRFIAEAPVVIAVVTDPRKSPAFHMVDGACAVQNLLLAAHALGLGTCWIGTMDRERAKEILGIPKDLHLLTVIPLGYPDERPKAPHRKPLESVVHYERYGQRPSKNRS